jgi:tetratricopeptide (TPR) repeat protein
MDSRPEHWPVPSFVLFAYDHCQILEQFLTFNRLLFSFELLDFWEGTMSRIDYYKSFGITPADATDPIILQWLLSKYSDLKKFDEVEAGKFEELFFNELYLKSILEKANERLLTSLFRSLPAERFRSHCKFISDGWQRRIATAENGSGQILMKLDPALAIAQFEKYFRSNTFWNSDSSNLADILDALIDVPAIEVSKDFVDRVISSYSSGPDQPMVEFLCSKVLHLARKFSHSRESELLQKFIDWGCHKENDADCYTRSLGTLDSIYNDDLPFFDFILGPIGQYSDSRFSQLSFFFKKDAPLKSFDEVIDLLEKKKNRKAADLYLKLFTPDHSSPMALAVTKALSGIEGGHKNLSGWVALGLSLEAKHFFEYDTAQISTLTRSETLYLISRDLKVVPHYPVLLQNLKSEFTYGDDELLLKLLKKNQRHYGAVNLIRLMRGINRTAGVRFLIENLENTSDCAFEESIKTLCKFGDLTITEFENRFKELNSTQLIAYKTVLSNNPSNLGISVMENRFKALFERDRESACDALQMIGHLGFLDLLEPHLHKSQSLIDGAYVVISKLNHLTNEKVALAEGRHSKHLKELETDFDNFRKDEIKDSAETVSLELKCTVCGDVNSYSIGSIWCSPVDGKKAKGDEPYFIAQELPCINCGAYNQFEFTPKATFAMTGALMKSVLLEKDGKQQNAGLYQFNKHPKRLIHIIPGIAYDGGKIAGSFNEVIRFYERKIKSRPKDMNAYISLASVYRNAGIYIVAIELLKTAIHVDPEWIEAWYYCADCYNKRGETETAFEILQKGMRYVEQPRFRDQMEMLPEQIIRECYSLHNSLLKKTKSKLPLLFPAASKTREKIGRNDPCPCGSGKKFKRCCVTVPNIVAKKERVLSFDERI